MIKKLLTEANQQFNQIREGGVFRSKTPNQKEQDSGNIQRTKQEVQDVKILKKGEPSNKGQLLAVITLDLGQNEENIQIYDSSNIVAIAQQIQQNHDLEEESVEYLVDLIKEQISLEMEKKKKQEAQKQQLLDEEIEQKNKQSESVSSNGSHSHDVLKKHQATPSVKVDINEKIPTINPEEFGQITQNPTNNNDNQLKIDQQQDYQLENQKKNRSPINEKKETQKSESLRDQIKKKTGQSDDSGAEQFGNEREKQKKVEILSLQQKIKRKLDTNVSQNDSDFEKIEEEMYRRYRQLEDYNNISLIRDAKKKIVDNTRLQTPNTRSIIHQKLYIDGQNDQIRKQLWREQEYKKYYPHSPNLGVNKDRKIKEKSQAEFTNRLFREKEVLEEKRFQKFAKENEPFDKMTGQRLFSPHFQKDGFFTRVDQRVNEEDSYWAQRLNQERKRSASPIIYNYLENKNRPYHLQWEKVLRNPIQLDHYSNIDKKQMIYKKSISQRGSMKPNKDTDKNGHEDYIEPTGEQTNQNLQEKLRPQLRDEIEQIFNCLDDDQDGVINSDNIDLSEIDTQVLQIIKDVIFEMEEKSYTLDLACFTQMLSNLDLLEKLSQALGLETEEQVKMKEREGEVLNPQLDPFSRNQKREFISDFQKNRIMILEMEREKANSTTSTTNSQLNTPTRPSRKDSGIYLKDNYNFERMRGLGNGQGRDTFTQEQIILTPRYKILVEKSFKE